MSWFCSEDFSSVVFSSPLCLPFSVTLGFPELPLPPVPVACVPLPGGAVSGGMAGRGLGSDRSGEDVRPAPCAPPVLPPCPPCAWHLGLSPAGSRERPPCHQPPPVWPPLSRRIITDVLHLLLSPLLFSLSWLHKEKLL